MKVKGQPRVPWWLHESLAMRWVWPAWSSLGILKVLTGYSLNSGNKFCMTKANFWCSCLLVLFSSFFFKCHRIRGSCNLLSWVVIQLQRFWNSSLLKPSANFMYSETIQQFIYNKNVFVLFSVVIFFFNFFYHKWVVLLLREEVLFFFLSRAMNFTGLCGLADRR